MKELLDTPLFFITLNVIAYYIGVLLQKKTGWMLFNPILVSLFLIIGFLLLFDIEYGMYQKNSRFIEFLLEPAIVCLAIPLYYQLKRIRQQFMYIAISSFVGSVTGIVSVVVVSWAMGAPNEITFSLLSKSVTTPIAIDITKVVGGIPSLTVCAVIFTGIFGYAFGYFLMHKARVYNPVSQGFSMGMASHALGASKSMEISANYGAFSTLGLIVNGIFTAIMAPYLLMGLQWLLDF